MELNTRGDCTVQSCFGCVVVNLSVVNPLFGPVTEPFPIPSTPVAERERVKSIVDISDLVIVIFNVHELHPS